MPAPMMIMGWGGGGVMVGRGGEGRGGGCMCVGDEGGMDGGGAYAG